MKGESMISGEKLTRNWFFKGLSKTQIEALLGVAQQASYTAGERVVVEGEPAESFHILVQGAVSIKMQMEGHGEMVLAILRQAGEIFGWSALVERGRSTATAECLEDTQILSFGRKDLETLFARDPVLGYCFMKRLAGLVSRRLESTRTLLVKQIS